MRQFAGRAVIAAVGVLLASGQSIIAVRAIGDPGALALALAAVAAAGGIASIRLLWSECAESRAILGAIAALTIVATTLLVTIGPPGQPRESITVTVAAQALLATALMVAVLTIRPPRAIGIMPEGPPYHR